MTVFLELFESVEDITREFAIEASALEGYEIHIAFYEYEDYSGNAFVLLEKDGVLYEVNGGHCSCHGLEEDQWELEETTVEALRHRIKADSYTLRGFKKELIAVLDGLGQK